MKTIKKLQHTLKFDGKIFYSSSFLANEKKAFDPSQSLKIGNQLFYQSKNTIK